MTEKHIGENEAKRIFYEELEEYARGKIRMNTVSAVA
jgi:hypothetical protein